MDVMDNTKKQNIPGILLFIVFEKAFDSIDWEFMVKCLDVFGFGPSLKGWIETFYKNISSCVINNGTCTSQFKIQRGVRQGDPMSPYLFIIVAEVLATAIRTTNIQGIELGKEEFKGPLTYFSRSLLRKFKESFRDRFLTISSRFAGMPMDIGLKWKNDVIRPRP